MISNGDVVKASTEDRLYRYRKDLSVTSD